MKKRTRLALISTVVLGVGGVALAWGLAATSTDAAIAKRFLLESKAVKEKYQELENPVLTGFRISSSMSRLTYWTKTPKGRVFVSVVINKDTDPWRVTEAP
jgi:hypothetical protein